MRRKAALICAAALWLCSWPVFAVETESCTLDTPAEWGGAISISDTYDQTEYTGIEAYMWQLESGESATLQLFEQDGGNPFDLSEEDVQQIGEEIQGGVVEELTAAFSADETLEGVEPILASGTMTREEFDGQPCFHYICQVDLKMDGEVVGSLYIEELNFLTRTHSITLVATAYDAASAGQMLNTMRDGFVITEECYTEKTPSVLQGIVEGLIFGAVVGIIVGVVLKVREKSKKQKAVPEHWDPEQ